MGIFRATMLTLFAVPVLSVPAHADPHATIAGAFADACRNFAADSSKDISHVVVHYADGQVVKDEAISAPGYTVDGGTGDEIEVVEVKSGRSVQSFRCDDGGGPPVALLEIGLSPYCQPYDDTIYWCLDGSTNPQRTVFVDPGELKIDMGCLPTERLCFAITVRGTGSTDPDGDLASWSIAFGDGAAASGDWGATPPDAVTHEYGAGVLCDTGTTYCSITLTVTDSRGQVAKDTVKLAFFDITPD